MFRKLLLPLLLLTLILAGVAVAQNTASIKGVVADQNGAAVPGATITVKNTAQGIERTTTTGAGGEYEIPALPPGTYSVEVKADKFQTQVAQHVELLVSQNTVQSFSLKVASGSEVVNVEATAPIIESTTMTVGQTINQRTVQEIPLNGRHFVDLALLIPGTVTPPQNGFLTAPLRGQGSFAFNSAGGREDAVNFMINGINLNDMVQNQVTFQPTINTVSEFKVDNSTYSAEFGRNSGSIVNIATRSGTNQFHGEGYEFLRNDYFDARNAFNRVSLTDPVTGTVTPNPIAPFKRNQFGGDFGGPIHKDTTFFFLSYEGLRQRQGLTFSSTVLSGAQRATVQSSGGPVAKALLGIIPVANGSLAGLPAFLGTGTAPVDIDQGTADIQHRFSNSDSLHGYYVYQRDLRRETAAGSSIPGWGDTRQGHRQVLTLNESHIFSPTLVNELRLGANRIHITFVPNNNMDPASLGLSAPMGPGEVFVPSLSLTFTGSGGFLTGAERNFPQGRGDTTFVIADTISIIRGKHSFKVGTEWRDFRNNNFNGDPGRLTYNSFNSFLNDTPDTVARTVGSVANRINEAALDFFAMDSFKVKPRLTIELGLRYAWNMTPSEALDRFVNFVPVISPTFDGSLLVRAPNPYGQNNGNVQPRLGFAWDVMGNSKFVVRGGYALQVDQPITGFVTGLNSNPPFALPVSISATPISALAPSLTPGAPGFVAKNLSPAVITPGFTNANIQSWNLNIQHQINNNMALMVGYFGNKGTHLEVDRNINQFATLGSSASRPFQKLNAASPIDPGATLGNSIRELDSSGTSTYNALWVSLNQHLSHNLQFNASYTLSHAIDEQSQNRFGIIIPNSNSIPSGKGNADFDARHRFVANAIYTLPFKRNRFVSGWEIANIVQWQTGNPFDLVIATSSLTGQGGTVTPVVFGQVTTTGNPLGQWIVGNFLDPATQLANKTFGNMARNTLYGPGFTNWDTAVVKNTKLTERVNFQIRADAFDVLNHPNYGQPGGGAGGGAATLTSASPANITISATRFPTGDFGSSRQIQLAAKLQF